MRIYLSGEITGDKDYIEKFNHAQKKVEDTLHAEVINPACLVLPESCTEDDYMRIRLQMLDLAEGVVMLPEWRKSLEARMECGYALGSDKNIIHYENIKGESPPPPKTAHKEIKVKKERICQKCGGQITGKGRKTLCDQCKESEESLPE